MRTKWRDKVTAAKQEWATNLDIKHTAKARLRAEPGTEWLYTQVDLQREALALTAFGWEYVSPEVALTHTSLSLTRRIVMRKRA